MESYLIVTRDCENHNIIAFGTSFVEFNDFFLSVVLIDCLTSSSLKMNLFPC